MTRLAALIAAAMVLVGLAVGAYIVVTSPGDDRFADCRRTQVASGRAEVGGPFELTDASGNRITDVALIDRPALVYFGYTYCPDFCPNDLARNALAADLLAERGVDVRLAFITIDPDRDTPEVAGDYATAIHPDMVGLSGTAEEIADAARAYRVVYRKAGDDPEYYLMDHTTFTYLMAPGIGFLDFYRSDLSAEAVADGAACFIGRL